MAGFFPTNGSRRLAVLIQGLIGLCYALAGVAVAVGLGGLASTGPSLAAWSAGGVVWVAGALAHLHLLARAGRRALALRMAEIEQGHEQATAELAGARCQMTELLADLEAARNQAEERIHEFRQLRRLVAQLATKLETPGKTDPALPRPPAPNPLPRRRAPFSARSRGPAVAVAAVAQTPLVAVPPAAPDPVVNLPPLEDVPGATPDEIQQIERIREALERQRVEMVIQPMVRLPQRRVEFYETFSRLAARDGTPILPEDYIELAGRAGLVPALDDIVLFRCVEQVRANLAEDFDIGYFCNISGATLSDRSFFPQFLTYLEANDGLAGRLILELSQAHLAKLDDVAKTQLDRLTAAGIGLSLDGVTDLDIDVAAVAAHGFKFIKLGAEALLPKIGEEPVVDLAGLRDDLARAGIALVVEKIESEEMLLDLLDYNIDFGQGYLFGEPKKPR